MGSCKANNYTSDSHLGFVFFLQHDGRERKQGWFLDEVQVTNPRKPQTWTFPCYQWLSLYESDCQVRRSLKPLVHKKVEKVVYVIEVYTGNKAGAGTDAHVFVTLFGKRGQTPKTQLSSKTEDAFERNKKDIFKIKASDKGPLRKIIVEHDNSGFSAGWFLDKIIVYCREREDRKFYFPCDQWLAKDEGDGQIVRHLAATTDSSAAFEGYQYLVHTYTGDTRGAGTDANVVITIFGDEGDSGEKKLDNARNNFERGKKDTFKVICGTFLGRLARIRIGHDNSGLGPGWFLNKVVVEDPKTGEAVDFPCRRWFSKSEDDGKISRELSRGDASEDDIIVDKGIPYHLHITTGDVRNASTNAKVYVILHGGEGEDNSGKLWLQNDKKDNFQRGRTDIFIVECEDIGPLLKIRIGHDNNGMRSAWFLEKVEVRRVKTEDKESHRNRRQSREVEVEEMSEGDDYNYLFMCNRWLARDEDDGQIVRELVPMDATGRPRRDSLPENTYRVHVFTGDVSNAGTNSNVFLCLYGELGDSGERKLEKSETHMDKFERNNEDIFSLNCINLGKLDKVKIWHDNSGLKPAWHLDRIEIEDKLAEENYAFPCNRWLATSEDDGQICRELVAVDERTLKLQRERSNSRKASVVSNVDGVDLEAKARINTYEVSVVTGDVLGAGTDANVFIVLFGEDGDT
ncbi:PREDICTED: lipoxygenase homology domain-containing protein 1-like, partial [Acropora digitifera]|uniref:lipoxygenase homology domain-containing protein 1-like n=1 Tax=Acropora digitifera TaxID=70779 RepID=UPI00077B1DE6